MTPSGADESGYRAAVIAIGHATLGALLSPLTAGAQPLSGLCVAIIYWVLKERRDLARGGRNIDGLKDAGFVALGTFYGPAWWPAAVLIFAVADGIHREARRA